MTQRFYIGQLDFLEQLNALSSEAGGGAVSYATAQSLSGGQQAQARSNIGFDAAALAVVLSGLSLSTSTAITSSDSVLSSLGKLQAQVTLRAPLASPALTGTPTAPTASAGTNTTQIATTAFVKAAVDNLITSAPGALDTLDELAAALGDDADFAGTVTTALAGKVSLSGSYADPSWITSLEASKLSGTTLASNVVNASLNAITPSGGTLSVTGSLTATGDAFVTGALSTVGSVQPKATPNALWGVDFAADGTGGANCITLANNAVYELAAGSGIVILHDEGTGRLGVFGCHHGNVGAIFNPDGFYDIAADVAGKVNIFYNGTDKYRIQNKTGGSVTLYVSSIRTRANT